MKSGTPLIECIPNFSEGRNPDIINRITEAIRNTPQTIVLDVDSGYDANRTVVTFISTPEYIVEAAFKGISKATELIDMRKQIGKHPRMGATDVCPLVPISGINMDKVVELSKQLARKVGDDLGIAVYLYEKSAVSVKRQNLANIRKGGYENWAEKIKKPEWNPDYGSEKFSPKSGVTAIGARDFLVAFNINLNTRTLDKAVTIAEKVRESGYKDKNGNRIKGLLKNVKAIAWYMDRYQCVQVSMNLTDINQTPMHIAYEAVKSFALEEGLEVSGSELVGLVPLKVMLEAGSYYQQQSIQKNQLTERELVKLAVIEMGMDSVSPFEIDHKVLEYNLKAKNAQFLV